MSNGYSSRSEDRKTYVPSLSELHRRHGRAKQFCSKFDCNGSCCAYDVLRSYEHGKPMACPKCSGTFAKPRLFNDDGSLVRPSGRGARGGKASYAMSTTERERQLEAQIKDLQQQLAKPAPTAGQGEVETVVVDDVEMGTAESKVNALRSQIKDLKADLAWANSLDPRRQSLLVGGLEGYTAAVQQQLDSTVEQLEGCKTPSQRMAAAQQREAKCIKAEKAAAERAASAKLALQLATDEAQEAEKALQGAKDELAKATAEVGALAAQRANGVFPATPRADTHDAPPGFIREDYATRLWMEREQNIQSIIAEAVATALARQQGQCSATPSEAASDDAPVPSEIDWFADDDSSWAKLDKGKRKALVNRERAEMAGKLKTTILKRVVNTEPPFKIARK